MPRLIREATKDIARKGKWEIFRTDAFKGMKRVGEPGPGPVQFLVSGVFGGLTLNFNGSGFNFKGGDVKVPKVFGNINKSSDKQKASQWLKDRGFPWTFDQLLGFVKNA